MGDRGQIHIVDSGVYLYTHYGASDLNVTLADALDRGRGRWDDEEYLARIIFSEMIKGDIDGTTGYGIGCSVHGDVWRVIHVDCENATVRDVQNGSSGPTLSFTDFCGGLGRVETEKEVA